MPRLPQQTKRSGRIPSDEVKAIAKKLQDFRKTKTKMTLTEVAEIMGLSKQYVSNIEKGEVGFSIDVMFNYCKAVGARPEIVFKKVKL